MLPHLGINQNRICTMYFQAQILHRKYNGTKNQGLPSEYVDNLFSCFLSGHVMNTMGDLYCPPCNITKRSTVSAMFRVLNGFASPGSHSPQGSSITQYRPLGRYGVQLGFTPNPFLGRNLYSFCQQLSGFRLPFSS